MQIRIKNKIYDVEIVKKRTTHNTYIRVKEDLTVYVTTNSFVSDKHIAKILEESVPSITRMIAHQEAKNNNKQYFNYLGKKYDIVYTNGTNITLGESKAFIPKTLDLEKWYKKEAEKLFKERLDYNYNNFSKKIPYPSLTIRKMTTRWGVCNTKLKRVTLNLELMKKDLECLDYVIVHELSHFIHQNHSKNFWSLVEENYPRYKEVRKRMKEE